jgi:hypothetical protein
MLSCNCIFSRLLAGMSNIRIAGSTTEENSHGLSWPQFRWQDGRLIKPLATARLKQGRLLGSMARLGVNLKLEAQLDTLTEDFIKSSEIEGEVLDRNAVRRASLR